MTRYPMIAAVSKALNDAYAVFAAVPRPTSLAGEPYDLQTVDAPMLLGTPLRELTASQLNAYAFKAVTTVGSPDDLRYFWPRLMEVSMDRDFTVDAPVLFGKLVLSRWWTWPRAEQEAIEAFVAAISDTWRLHKVSAWFADELDDWICAFGQFLPDITPVLEPLRQRGDAAAHNLSLLLEWNADAWKDGRLSNRRWEQHHRHSIDHPAWASCASKGEPNGNPNVRRVLAFFLEAVQSGSVNEREELPPPPKP